MYVLDRSLLQRYTYKEHTFHQRLDFSSVVVKGMTLMTISIPLDTDGFVRRQCPSCRQEFKWQHQSTTKDVPSLQSFFCPYCGQVAPIDEAFTEEQIELARATVAQALFGSLPKDQSSAPSGSSFSITISTIITNNSPPPVPLVEPDDMQRVILPCHPDEPIKILDEWIEAIHCLVCGKAYSV